MVHNRPMKIHLEERTSMKAMIYEKYGSPDVLKLSEVAKPTAKDNEVLVQIHAASVNPLDWHNMRGTPFLVRLTTGLRYPKNTILGADIAGRVEAVGRNVKHFKPGDEVFGESGLGGLAEYVCVAEDRIVHKPANMTFEEAAAIPVAALTALQGLRDKGQIQSGQKVLINGASGGVGTCAIQMAKSFGAEVTAVDKAEKRDIMLAVGADHVIDYIQENFTQHGQRYDLILDVIATRSIIDYMRILDSKGTYVMVGGSTARILQLALLGPLISRITAKKMGILIHKPNKQDLNDINGLYESGSIKPIIDKHFPLHEVPDALRYYGEGQTRGKIVITMEQ